MTDNEIIKDMIGCSGNYEHYYCDDCAYHRDTNDCVGVMLKDALSLINRQKAEIEHLNRVVQTTAECAYESRQMAMEWARAEGVKEFVGRLKGYSLGSDREHECRMKGKFVFVRDIERIAEEVVGDSDG